MATGSEWFEDPQALMGTLRRSREAAPAAPSISGYGDLQELRRGGQGVVYLATQLSTRRRVAVKVLLDGAWSSPARRRRFEREVDLVASLRHPNIVRVYDSGLTQEGHPYFVMEFIDGVALDELLGPGRSSSDAARPSASLDLHDRPPSPAAGPRLPRGTALELFARICEAVSFAHQHGVIHRDLKPSNIRIDREGTPHVLDFGLAKSALELSGDSDATQVSRTGDFLGSLPWASPEQAEGAPDKIDVRSDVYSLGVILFQMLTGQFPYAVVGPLRDVLTRIQEAAPARPSSLQRGLDDEIDTIVLKCLAKEPARRYQSAAELARDVRRYLAGEPIEAKRDSAWYALRKRVRRYRLAASVAAAFVLVAAAAAVTTFVLWQRADAAEQLARSRLSATQAARDAEAEARAQAEAVSRFMVEMLSQPIERGREARIADLLDHAAAELSAGIDASEPTQAALYDALGTSYAGLGLYDQALPLLDKALAERRRLLGEDDPATLTTRSNKAWLLRLMGRNEESETLYRDVLERRQRTLGPGHLSTAQTLNDLAIVLEALGRLDEAESMLRDALTRLRPHVDASPRDALTATVNLANVLHGRGRLAEAEALLRDALQSMQSSLRSNDPNLLSATNNLAVLCIDLARFDDAIALSEQVAETRAETLGPDHPDTLRSRMNLAAALEAAGRLDDAAALLADLTPRIADRLGPRHADTLSAFSIEARTLQALGRLEQAEPRLRHVLEQRRDTLGPEHPATLEAANNLAVCLHELRRLDDAETLYRQVVDAQRRRLGDEAPATLTPMLNLAIVLCDRGALDEAESLTRTVAESRRRQLGQEHPDTLVAEMQIADVMLARGAAEDAAEHMAGVVATAERVLPPDHWYLPALRGFRGKCLLAAKRYEEAERELLASHEQSVRLLGADHWRVQRIAERLVELYEVWGRRADADRFRPASHVP